MLTAIALDDERPALEILECFAEKSPKIELLATFTSSDKALDYINKHAVDLLFIDINMPSITGLEFVKSFVNNKLVIFTTAYSEYALDSYELGGVDYLLKPFDYNRFSIAVDKAQIAKSGKILNLKPLSLKVGYRTIHVQPENILVAESWDNYVKIHMDNSTVHIARTTMSSIISELPPELFARAQRSFVVNLKKIDSIKGREVNIGGIQVLIGQKYKEDFMSILDKMGSK